MSTLPISIFAQNTQRLAQERHRINEMTPIEASLEHRSNRFDYLLHTMQGGSHTLVHAAFHGRLQDMLYTRSLEEK